jgi:hypothetical protein
MPKHDDPGDQNNILSLREQEEAAVVMPNGPEKDALLKAITKMRHSAALHSAVRKEIRERGGGEGLDPAPFPLDYPDD